MLSNSKIPLGGTNIRLHRGAGASVVDTSGRGAACRSGLWCRLVPQCSDRHGNFAMHPVTHRSESPNPARHRPLPPAPQDRKHVRPIEGLAPHCYEIRPMPDPVPLGLRTGSHGHLLVMSLEPSRMCVLRWLFWGDPITYPQPWLTRSRGPLTGAKNF